MTCLQYQYSAKHSMINKEKKTSLTTNKATFKIRIKFRLKN